MTFGARGAAKTLVAPSPPRVRPLLSCPARLPADPPVPQCAPSSARERLVAKAMGCSASDCCLDLQQHPRASPAEAKQRLKALQQESVGNPTMCKATAMTFHACVKIKRTPAPTVLQIPEDEEITTDLPVHRTYEDKREMLLQGGTWSSRYSAKSWGRKGVVREMGRKNMRRDEMKCPS